MPDPTDIPAQLQHAVKEFEKHFHRKPHYAAVAPGRVNLIGEHIDYNDGFVLPMAIQRQTIIVADKAQGTGDDAKRVRIVSTLQPGESKFDVCPSLKPEGKHWTNYVRGVIVGCLNKGLNPGGFDALVESNVPLGGGLSSSAALEMSTATLIEAITGKRIDPAEKAMIGVFSEHEFAHVPCGVMDQSISSRGKAGHAMLLDCRSLQTKMVPMADASVAVLIANTNVKHELTGGEYAERRAQCEAAAKAIGVKSLRDATMAQLDAAKGKMKEVEHRRGRHAIGEIARTQKAAEDLAASRWEAFGKAMYDSHNSLRDDFEVSCVELDVLVELAHGLGMKGGVYGSRMTGGGFGGCTVSLIKTAQADAISRHLHDGYKKRFNIEPTIFATAAAEGARILSI